MLTCCLAEKLSRVGVVAVLSNEEREEATRVDEDAPHASSSAYAAARCGYLSVDTSRAPA